jgi:hypothetical protein
LQAYSVFFGAVFIASALLNKIFPHWRGDVGKTPVQVFASDFKKQKQ